MRKLIFTLVCLLALSSVTMAQICDPDLTITDPEGNGEIVTDLPEAYDTETSYQGRVTVLVPSDTAILPLITCDVVSFDYLGAVDIPPGFTIGCNPGDCIFPGGDTVCVGIVGDPSVAGPGDYLIKPILQANLDCPVLGPLVIVDTTEFDSLIRIVINETPSCADGEAPENLQSSFSAATVDFSWSQVQGALGYRVEGGPVGAGVGALPPQLGQTNTTKSLPLGILTPGQAYQWRVTAACGTAANPLPVYSSPFANFIGPGARLSAENVPTANSINVYPNPATQHFSFVYESARDAQAQLTVYDLMGRVVMSETPQFAAGTNMIYYNLTDDMTDGVYLLEIIDGNEKTTSKFTVAR